MERRATSSESSRTRATKSTSSTPKGSRYQLLLPLFLANIVALLFIAQWIQSFVPVKTSTHSATLFNSSQTWPHGFSLIPTSASHTFLNEHGLMRWEVNFKSNDTGSQQQPLPRNRYDRITTPITLTKRIGRLRVKVLPFINISEVLEIEHTGWVFKRFGWWGILKLREQRWDFGRVRGWFELEELTANDFLDGNRVIYRNRANMYTAKLSEITAKELRKEEQSGSCEGVAIMPRTVGDLDSRMFAFFYGCTREYDGMRIREDEHSGQLSTVCEQFEGLVTTFNRRRVVFRSLASSDVQQKTTWD
ncbi:hypothetical protein BJ508DRAFT_301889 [Ascobolus immersus RN42]|uniref:Uncharacterized protein n=1 Tax=Ascobolus immersus RN42 TaxID=1160509 RepID=A0A3N4IK57_ASCIM|nr:hypothetical protein BJ508DRAFT_301889 [Ascobolus immersus RN42]